MREIRESRFEVRPRNTLETSCDSPHWQPNITVGRGMRGNVHSYSSIVREPLQSVKYRSGRDLCNIDTEKKCMLQEGIDQLFRALNHTDQSIRHRKPKFQSLEPMIHLFLLFFLVSNLCKTGIPENIPSAMLTSDCPSRCRASFATGHAGCAVTSVAL